MHLAQILFIQGFGTRRQCAGIVAAGRVRIGGQVVDDPHADVATEDLVFDPRTESFTVECFFRTDTLNQTLVRKGPEGSTPNYGLTVDTEGYLHPLGVWNAGIRINPAVRVNDNTWHQPCSPWMR